MTAQVRAATAHDEDAALRVWQVASGAAGERSGGTRGQRFRDRLRAATSLALVAERDGEVVGVLVAELARDAPGTLDLTALAVLPRAQRTGVARALVEHLRARYPQVRAQGAPEHVLALLGHR